MALSIGTGRGPIADINTTPLVDVMLVLLIIFLITVPVVTQGVPVELPNVPYLPSESDRHNVNLTVRGEPDGSCGVYWDVKRVDAEALAARGVRHLETFRASRAPGDPPEVRIRGDRNAPYKCVGGTIYAMQRVGFARIAFISEPRSSARL
jgi:biopolymer transport protein ExbD